MASILPPYFFMYDARLVGSTIISANRKADLNANRWAIASSRSFSLPSQFVIRGFAPRRAVRLYDSRSLLVKVSFIVMSVWRFRQKNGCHIRVAKHS